MKRRAMYSRLLILGLLVMALSACSKEVQPDLVRLYARRNPSAERVPVIVIPGILGSRLVHQHTGEELWPGSFWALLTGRHLQQLALPVTSEDVDLASDDLVPSGVFFDIAGHDFYKKIVETLETAGGYRCEPLAEMVADTDCILFAWDWRKDMVRAAAQLDAAIERLRAVRQAPDLRVDLVAHSAGGLVSRYFLRFGSQDVLADEQPVVTQAGSAKVRKVVLIATPNFGSIRGLQRSITSMPIGFSSLKQEVMATMSSLYQLLPHPDRTWMINIHGERVDQRLYELATWRASGWSVFDPEVRQRIRGQFQDAERANRYLTALEASMARRLERSKRFHRALSIPITSSPTRFIVFGSACFATPARCLLEQVNGEWQVWLRPRDVVNRVPGVDYERLMIEPGDGAVTKASLLARDFLEAESTDPGSFPIDYAVFICEEHTTLPSNVTFRDNLLNILSD